MIKEEMIKKKKEDLDRISKMKLLAQERKEKIMKKNEQRKARKNVTELLAKEDLVGALWLAHKKDILFEIPENHLLAGARKIMKNPYDSRDGDYYHIAGLIFEKFKMKDHAEKAFATERIAKNRKFNSEWADSILYG